MRRLLQFAALAASLALVFSETLRPAGGPNHVALAPWTTEQLEAVNVLGNVALFALPAAVLWSFRWSLRRTVAAGFVLSLGIELLQLAIPRPHHRDRRRALQHLRCGRRVAAGPRVVGLGQG